MQVLLRLHKQNARDGAKEGIVSKVLNTHDIVYMLTFSSTTTSGLGLGLGLMGAALLLRYILLTNYILNVWSVILYANAAKGSPGLPRKDVYVVTVVLNGGGDALVSQTSRAPWRVLYAVCLPTHC